MGLLAFGVAPARGAEPPDLLAPLPLGTDCVTQMQRELGRDARVLQTDHFVLVHTLADDAAGELGDRLEAVYRANARLLRGLRIPVEPPRHKLAVLVFGTYGQFRARQRSLGSTDEDVLGFYDPSGNRAVFFDLATYPPIVQLRAEIERCERVASSRRSRLIAKLRLSTEALLAKVIQHEAAHQIHFSVELFPASGEAPTWLVEGLAQMSELPFVERGATFELSTNHYRLYEFTELHGEDGSLLDDLERIVADDPWRGGADYSLSWALTNYLYKRQRARFACYLRQITTQREPIARTPAARRREFERFFGALDEHFTTRLVEYTRRLEDRYGGQEKLDVLPRR